MGKVVARLRDSTPLILSFLIIQLDKRLDGLDGVRKSDLLQRQLILTFLPPNEDGVSPRSPPDIHVYFDKQDNVPRAFYRGKFQEELKRSGHPNAIKRTTNFLNTIVVDIADDEVDAVSFFF